MMERKRYDSIQALRALAALCVILCHIEGSVGGQFGVDIFMCITGFMIAYTTDGSACAGEFLRHRAVRILPLYYAVTVLTYISALAMPSLFWTTVATAPNLLKSFFFLPYESRGGHILPVFPIGWTINYEMGFYILAAAAMKWFPKRKTWFMQASLLALVLAGEVFRPQNAVLKFWTSEILLEFCFGMFVFEAFKRFGKEAGCKKFRGGGFLVPILLFWMFLADFQNLDLPRSVKWGIPAAALLSICVFWFGGNSMFEKKPLCFLVKIGDASYSLYLTHYFVVKVLERVFHMGSGNFWGKAAVCFLGSLLVAFFVYEMAEKRIAGFYKAHKQIGGVFGR